LVYIINNKQIDKDASHFEKVTFGRHDNIIIEVQLKTDSPVTSNRSTKLQLFLTY